MATKKVGERTTHLKKAKKLEATKALTYQPYVTIKGTKQG
jgi:hypothetical protein